MAKIQIFLCLLIGFTCFPCMNSLQSIVIDSNTMDSELAATSNQNILQAIERTPELKTFLDALNATGLNAALQGPGSWTVFAPSNAAFSAMSKQTLKDLMNPENRVALETLLKNHIVKGSLTTNRLNAGNLQSLGGKPLHIHVRGSQVTVDDANITQADIMATNGVVQVIDAVLGQ